MYDVTYGYIKWHKIYVSHHVGLDDWDIIMKTVIGLIKYVETLNSM